MKDITTRKMIYPERHKVIPTANIIPIKDGKILLARRFNTGWEDGKFSLIGGHIEKNELATTAMCREALEEVGIIINPKDLKFVQLGNRLVDPKKEGHERHHIIFEVSKWQNEPKIMEPNKCDALDWFSFDDLPELDYVTVEVLKNYLEKNYFWEKSEINE